MSDSLSYADRARKAISPSNLAVKALSIVAHHTSPQPIDDWPQVGSQRKVDSSKKPSPIANKSNNLAFIVSKSISSPACLQPSQQTQIRCSTSTSSSSGSQTPAKVIFGSLGLETPPSLSPKPAVAPEIPTKTPTFSVGLDDSNEPVPARLKSRTLRLDTEEPESYRINHPTIPTSAYTTQPPNKWKFGTTTGTPVVNGKNSLPSDEPSSSSLLFHQPHTDSNHRKAREKAISFGYIDTLLPPDENVSSQAKSKTKSKTKPKVNPSTKHSPPVVTENLDPNPNSIPVSTSEDKDADSDPDFKVRDFGFGFGSGGVRYTLNGEQDNETGDKQNGQSEHSPQPSAGPLINDNMPQNLPTPNLSTTPPYQHGHLSSSRPRRGNTFGIPRGGGYGSYNERGSHERGYALGYERGRRARGGMNGYPRGYPSGRGYNRGGGGPGTASSHSSPSSGGGGGGGGQRVPYDTITSPTFPPPHFSQLPQQHHVMDPMYYPPPRHGGPAPFDPYQPYPHLQQPHYPHFQQVPPPLPPHLLASVSSTSVSNSSTGGGISIDSPTASGSGGDDVTSTSTSTSASASPPPSTSSTSPRSSTPSSHSSPPVPMPLTILPFPLDPIRYYLLGQLEYYLSPQNMVQDFFLRQQMDTKGYIPISLLASFNRIKQLTLDTRLVKEVLLLSAFVEVNGGMVRMGGTSYGEGPNQNRSSWESFVLPDAAESVVDDVDNVDGGYGYHHQQQLNGYGYGGSGYGYGYGTGYGYGYGYGYPPAGATGLGYYEDAQSQQPHQEQGTGGYEPGGGEGVVDEHGYSPSHDREDTVPSIVNGHGGGVGESHKAVDATSSPLSKEKAEEEEMKPNGILKHGDEEEYEEEDDEEEDVVFVMGTDVSTSWMPERERHA